MDENENVETVVSSENGYDDVSSDSSASDLSGEASQESNTDESSNEESSASEDGSAETSGENEIPSTEYTVVVEHDFIDLDDPLNNVGLIGLGICLSILVALFFLAWKEGGK